MLCGVRMHTIRALLVAHLYFPYVVVVLVHHQVLFSHMVAGPRQELMSLHAEARMVSRDILVEVKSLRKFVAAAQGHEASQRSVQPWTARLQPHQPPVMHFGSDARHARKAGQTRSKELLALYPYSQ